MTERVSYNTDINNDMMDEVMREAFDGLGDEARKHFEALGYRLGLLRHAYNNLQWLNKISIKMNSTSEEKLKILRDSLQHDIEQNVIHLLILKSANNCIILSD